MYLAQRRLCNFVLLSIITISKISISYNCNQYKDMSPQTSVAKAELVEDLQRNTRPSSEITSYLEITLKNEGTPKKNLRMGHCHTNNTDFGSWDFKYRSSAGFKCRASCEHIVN